jgi:hypothetical protein
MAARSVNRKALGELAEELAQLAAQGTPEAAAAIGRRIREEAPRHQVDEWGLTHLVGGEWVRLGIVRPGGPMTAGFQ